jgi:signal transduction histidine kinase
VKALLQRAERVLGTLALGLRPRVLIALVLTSAVTLAVAALALLSPLEQRLRESAESALRAAVASTRTELSEEHVDPATGLPEEIELRATLDRLRRGQAAQPVLLDEQLEVVGRSVPSDFDIPLFYPIAEQVLLTHRGSEALRGDIYIIARPVRIGRAPYVLVVLKRLDYVASAVSSVESAFVVAAAAGLGTALLLGVALSGRLVVRLRRLRDAARELEQRGPGVALALGGWRDEVGELARSLESMRKRLADQDAALRSFIATASHELRTPLASLEGLLELVADDLEEEHLDLADARQRTMRAREQARRLTSLATDLLDLSRIDSGTPLRSEPIELTELARAVAAEMELRAAGREVAIAVHAAPEPIWARADPGALARILRILIDNALRFSPVGSTVQISAERGEGRAILTVADEGPGVPADERELIFARFRRGSQTGGAGGFGLGLAIGRELAQRMGGSLSLRTSQPASGGATFALELPSGEESRDA